MENKHSNAEIKGLIFRLGDLSGLVRERARKQLVVIGEEAIPHLLELIDHKRRILRWESMKALSEISTPALIPVYIDNLDNEESEIRWMAAEGLIGIGTPVLKPLLEALETKNDNEFVLLGIHHVLHDLHKKDQLPEGFPVKTFLKLLKRPGSEERIKIEAYKILKGLR